MSSAERLNQIKQIIHEKYNEIDIQSKIREIIAEKLREVQEERHATTSSSGDEQSRPQKLTHDMVLQEVKKKGIVDSVMKELVFERQKFDGQQQSFRNLASDNSTKRIPKLVDKSLEYTFSPAEKVNVDPSKRHLYIHFSHGKAFLEYLLSNQPDSTLATSHFTIHVQFREQRFKTRAFACSCEPKINEGFLIEMDKILPHELSHAHTPSSTSLMLDKDGLLAITDKIHIVMVRTDRNSSENHLIASSFFEWRSLLSVPGSKKQTAVELMGVGEESKVPAGIVYITMQLVPALSEPLRDDILETQLAIEHSKNSERERLFLVYSKQWWREFLEIRDDHKYRYVKIFAQDENGANRPVCSYVKPMEVGRLLDTPRQAARFVSLIGYVKSNPTMGGLKENFEQWLNLHTFLARNKGDCENHAILLCNILLGFGLDAYVCLGTKIKSNTPHAWVATAADNFREVVFWESLTGNRYLHVPIDPDNPPLEKAGVVVKHQYKTIGCVFNHRTLYANIQPLPNVETCSFNLRDQSKWKAMSEDAITTVTSRQHVTLVPHMPPICKSVWDGVLLANDLESELKLTLIKFRQQLGLNTTLDKQLSYILTPALASYEHERVTGVSVGNEEFDQAVRFMIPDGHTFKAFPIQFNHANAARIFNACLDAAVGEEIIKVRGDQVRLALRVKVFTYPESVLAVWVMFACSYKLII